MANTKRNERPTTDGLTPASYDPAFLDEIARQVNWNAIHGPKWMKAGRFSPGPGLGDLQRSRQEAAAADIAKKRNC